MPTRNAQAESIDGKDCGILILELLELNSAVHCIFSVLKKKRKEYRFHLGYGINFQQKFI